MKFDNPVKIDKKDTIPPIITKFKKGKRKPKNCDECKYTFALLSTGEYSCVTISEEENYYLYIEEECEPSIINCPNKKEKISRINFKKFTKK